MNATKIIAIVLIVAGALALLYGGFSYTKDTTAVKLGPIELTVQEKKTVNVPLWMGIGASNQLGEFESGATAALLGPVGSVVAGGIGTVLVALSWRHFFPALARRDRLDPPAAN